MRNRLVCSPPKIGDCWIQEELKGDPWMLQDRVVIRNIGPLGRKVLGLKPQWLHEASAERLHSVRDWVLWKAKTWKQLLAYLHT